ncbi:MAG: hypothetical protein AAFU41_03050 [Pseudomonadota bacterium]
MTTPVGAEAQGDSSLRAWGIAVCAVLVVTLPILLHPHLPLIDLPNHIARHYIAANPGTALDAYYSYSFAMNGNATGDLLWLAVGQHLTDVFTFSAYLMSVYAGGLVLAAFVLGRVFHGYWSIMPLAAVLVVFNTPFFWGFQNYLLTVPLALFALAAWLHFEGARPWARAIAFLPVSYLLFQLHILGFLIFLVSAFGREVQRLVMAGRFWLDHLKANLVLAVPFLPPVGLILWRVLTGARNAYGNRTAYGSWDDRQAMVTSLVDTVETTGTRSLSLTGTVVMVLLAGIVLFLARQGGVRLRLSSRALGPAIALLILCLAIPATLDGVGFVHVRFPFVLLVVLLAGASLHGATPRGAVMIFAIFAVAALGRSAAFERYAAEHSADMADLSVVLDAVPDGARVMPIRAISGVGWHVQAHAVPQAEAFVPTLFLGAHALSVSDKWKDLTAAQGISVSARNVLGPEKLPDDRLFRYARGWRENFTHALIVGNLSEEMRTGENLRLLARAGRFEVYAIPD